MAMSRPSALFVCTTLVLAACDDPAVDLPEQTETVEASVVTRDAAAEASVKAECDQAPDGTPCGEDAGAALKHCLYNACVLNVCGDGIKAGDEVCDDGDQEDGDGCNSLCVEAACGNGVIDAREQCDDGNTANGDDCSSTCRDTPRDGGVGTDAGQTVDGSIDGGMDSGAAPITNTNMDAGEAPVDTGAGASDTGSSNPVDSGTPDTGAADAGQPGDAAACQACVRAREVDSPCPTWYFSGPDNVADCFSNPDPTWVERCTALYRCAVRAPDNCAADPTGVTKCFCGETPIETCFTGAATAQPKGPCIAEVYAASQCTTPQCAEGFINSPDRPSYSAYYLTLCTTSPDACGPSCPLGSRY